MNNKTPFKKRTFLRTVPLVILLIISTKYVFDEAPFNDYKGWMAMIGFWVYMSLFELIVAIRKRNKVSMFLNSILVLAGLGLLFLYITEYF